MFHLQPEQLSTCCVWSSPDIKEISGGFGTMYVVSWATKWTCRGSCHGVTPAWWTNISAYKVPLFRVFLGRDTFTILEGRERKREGDTEKKNFNAAYHYKYECTGAHLARLISGHLNNALMHWGSACLQLWIWLNQSNLRKEKTYFPGSVMLTLSCVSKQTHCTEHCTPKQTDTRTAHRTPLC